MPRILLANTAILLASSVVLDGARRALRTGKRRRFNFWWSAATILGVVFLAGQALAWGQLRDAGFLLATAPSSSFFYLLTAAHAIHLLGGLIALTYVGIQAWRLHLGPARRTAIDVSAIFWHFLVAVWIYVVVLLRVWG
jgi:cytochrome c oxidase subunit 3